MSSLVTLMAAFSIAVPSAVRAQAPADSHLNQAKVLLEGIPETTTGLVSTTDKDTNKKAAEELAALRAQFAELSGAYGAPGGTTDWKIKFSDVERTLSRLIGGGSGMPSETVGAAVVVAGVAPSTAAGVNSTRPVALDGAGLPPAVNAVTGAPAPATATGATSGTGAVGTSGATPPVEVAPTAGTVPAQAPATGVVAADGNRLTQPAGVAPTPSDSLVVTDSIEAVAASKVSTIGIKELNPDVRRQLEKFRTEIELLFTAPVAERQR